jgi:hypothetical protein
MERQNVVLWKRPFQTLQYFILEVFNITWNFLKRLDYFVSKINPFFQLLLHPALVPYNFVLFICGLSLSDSRPPYQIFGPFGEEALMVPILDWPGRSLLRGAWHWTPYFHPLFGLLPSGASEFTSFNFRGPTLRGSLWRHLSAILSTSLNRPTLTSMASKAMTNL